MTAQDTYHSQLHVTSNYKGEKQTENTSAELAAADKSWQFKRKIKMRVEVISK